MLSQLFEQKGMYYSTRKSHFPSIVLASFMNVCNCVKYLFAQHRSGIVVKMRIFIQVEGNGDCMFSSLVKQMIF